MEGREGGERVLKCYLKERGIKPEHIFVRNVYKRGLDKFGGGEWIMSKVIFTSSGGGGGGGGVLEVAIEIYSKCDRKEGGVNQHPSVCVLLPASSLKFRTCPQTCS